jgi:hypothetical protein
LQGPQAQLIILDAHVTQLLQLGLPLALKAWLPRGLQGMLEGLAEEIVGDGRP